jgi:hypothetical protein
MRRTGATIAAFIVAGIGCVNCSGDTGGGGGLPSGATGGGAGRAGIPTAGSLATGSGGTTGTGTGGSKSISVGGSSNFPVAGSTGSSTGGSGGGEACTGQKASGMKGQSAVVMLLVDLSLSMDERARGDDQSKLEATKEALAAAIQDLPEGLGIGLIFYPEVSQPPPGESLTDLMPCFAERVAVPIAPLDAAQRAALTTAVEAADSDGSTPTHDAYVFALNQLQASTLEGQKYIVLITDGSPTYGLGCIGPGLPPGVDPGPLVTESENALASRMIKTFVIGSPGSENAREALSAMARVGGTGATGCADTGTPEYCHFDMTQSSDVAAGLTSVLGEISQQIPIDCNFEIPPPPNSQDTIDVGKTNVIYNGMPVPYDQSCSSASAWRFDDPVQPTQVVFCGTLCDQVKTDATAMVDIQFGCVRIDVPR